MARNQNKYLRNKEKIKLEKADAESAEINLEAREGAAVSDVSKASSEPVSAQNTVNMTPPQDLDNNVTESEVILDPEDARNAAGTARSASSWRRFAARAAVVPVVFLAGWIVAQAFPASRLQERWPFLAGFGLSSVAADPTAQLLADLRSSQNIILERLNRIERTDVAAALTRLGSQIDRIESASQDAPKQTALSTRLDRIERQLNTQAPAQTAAARPDPAVAGSLATPPRPSPAPGQIASANRDGIVPGWVLHDVYDGVALVEGRDRRLVEIGPGETLEGIGRVESIQRRAGRWVVVTARGIIEMAR